MLVTCPFDAALSRLVEELFLDMLPTIRRVAVHAFRRVRASLREEFVAEVIANAFTALRRLVERGKALLAYPTVLARYAIRQVRAGRRVGNSLNAGDVLSPNAQQRQAFQVHSLSQQRSGNWEEVLVEDRRATPADIAAVRIDFRAWLGNLSPWQCAVALELATGTSTSDAALRLGVTRGRISQLRRELAHSWAQFQAERCPASRTRPAGNGRPDMQTRNSSSPSNTLSPS